MLETASQVLAAFVVVPAAILVGGVLWALIIFVGTSLLEEVFGKGRR